MPLVNNVCRLCLSKENLVWVFDKRLESENNMKDMILITTGVEINENDVISQMICENCCQISIRMFLFRKASQKHDRYLKKQHEEMLKKSSVGHDILNTGLRIETEKRVVPKMETEEFVKPNQKCHQTVTDLLKIYPRLKLPSICLKSNIEPCIIIETEMVENVLKKKAYSEQKCVRLPEHENTMTENSTSAKSVMNAEKNCEIDHYNKENQKQSINSVSESVDEHLNEGDSFSDDESEIIDETIIKRKRRRLTDSDFSTDAKTKNFSSSEPLPQKKVSCESAEQLYSDESVPMFLCSICNSVHNNVRELKRHQFKHLRCQFCGLKFRTIGLKKAHIQSLCPFKKIINHSPTVKLEKIELNSRFRTKYPEAFIGFPLIAGRHLDTSSAEETSENKPPEEGKPEGEATEDKISGNQTSEEDERVVGWKGGCDDNDDIIEILSDDDCSLPSRKETCNNPSLREQKLSQVPNITQVINSEISATYSTVTEKLPKELSPISTNNPAIPTTPSVISTTTSVMSPTLPVISNMPAVSSTAPVISTSPPVISTTLVRSTSPPVISSTCPGISKAMEDRSVALVKPEIKIRNSGVLDTIDPNLSEINVFKELLTKNSSLKIKKDESSQTELPCNKSISVNKSGQPSEFKALKNLLYSYKIPILSKNGDFQVRYDYKFSNSKPRRVKKKKLHLWNKLTPVDVKVTNISSNSQGVDRIRNTGITSDITAPSISTSSLTNNCTTTTINAFNPPYSTVPNQQMYNRNNSFSTPLNSFTSTSNVNIYTQVVPSNFGIVNEVPNSFTASNVQMYPQTSSVQSNFKVSVGTDPRYVPQGANIAGLQTTPTSYPNEVRNPPNVNPFVVPNMAVTKTTTVVSQNSMINAPHISNSHSILYNSLVQNSLGVQNKLPDPEPHRWPITTASGSNVAGPVFGNIRVKSVWELT